MVLVFFELLSQQFSGGTEKNNIHIFSQHTHLPSRNSNRSVSGKQGKNQLPQCCLKTLSLLETGEDGKYSEMKVFRNIKDRLFFDQNVNLYIYGRKENLEIMKKLRLYVDGLGE